MSYNNTPPWAKSSNRYYGQIVQESEASKFASSIELEKENAALKAKIEYLQAQNRELRNNIENLKAYYALKP
jgi:cell division protein FtsB